MSSIDDLSAYSRRLRRFMAASLAAQGCSDSSLGNCGNGGSPVSGFNELALDLFALHYLHNEAYRKLCDARSIRPGILRDWSGIPAVPTSAFKQLDVTCLPPGERTHVFHSSGTTEQTPSRHFHNRESLGLYESSLWLWFRCQPGGAAPNLQGSQFSNGSGLPEEPEHLRTQTRNRITAPALLILTPDSIRAPHSSLVHMFATIAGKVATNEEAFVGRVSGDGSWTLDFDATMRALDRGCSKNTPMLLMGTAFLFVNLLDEMSKTQLRLALPPGSRVLETGGYKGRSRVLSRDALHQYIEDRLGVRGRGIICEYGMAELSSQAYNAVPEERSKSELPEPSQASGAEPEAALPRTSSPEAHRSVVANRRRGFAFPPWARAEVTSPETGRVVEDGQMGLIRVLDLANVFSILAVQTEDLAVKRGGGFELIGRARNAEARGCALMSKEG